MAWAPIALAIAGSVMQMGGQLTQADAAKRAGEQQRVADEFRSKQLAQDAGQTRAMAQRAKLNEEHRAKLVASRAMALAGSSGGGLSDPTIQGILADIEGEGALRAASAVYEGEARARKLEMGSEGAALEGQIAEGAGRNRQSAMRTAAFGSLMQGIGQASMFSKYGMGGPQQTASLSSGASWYDAGTPSFSPYA
jgi:hypothetical protein